MAARAQERSTAAMVVQVVMLLLVQPVVPVVTVVMQWLPLPK